MWKWKATNIPSFLKKTIKFTSDVVQLKCNFHCDTAADRVLVVPLVLSMSISHGNYKVPLDSFGDDEGVTVHLHLFNYLHYFKILVCSIRNAFKLRFLTCLKYTTFKEQIYPDSKCQIS